MSLNQATCLLHSPCCPLDLPHAHSNGRQWRCGSGISRQQRQCHRSRRLHHCVHAATRRVASPRRGTGTATIKTALQQQRSVPGESVEPGDVPLWDRFYNAVSLFPFPLSPFFERRTIRKEVDPGRIWLFEQEQSLGFSNVTTVVRMTVIRLDTDELWVHCPVAPTRECVELVKDLGLPVRYIVLPTFAVEHKRFVGPFSRSFREAEVWLAPRQWSWPLPLPVQLLGIFPTGTIQSDDQQLPWSNELQHKVFVSAIGGAGAGVGPYVEVVFFHKASRTLLVTDAVVCIQDRPPEVVRKANLLEAGGPLPGIVRALSSIEDPRSVRDKLFDGSMERPLERESAILQQGWERMALQVCYFVPGNLLKPSQSFKALAGRLVVSPVLQTLVFSKNPSGSRDFVDRVTSDPAWQFRRIIPAHFAAPVKASPAEFRNAFQFVYDMAEGPAAPKPQGLFSRLLRGVGKPTFVPPKTDMRALDILESLLKKGGVFK